jgi:hypothetical protein
MDRYRILNNKGIFYGYIIVGIAALFLERLKYENVSCMEGDPHARYRRDEGKGKEWILPKAALN